MAIPDHLTCFLRNLYAGQVATVRTGHETTSWFKIGKGIQGGCILSPCLFNFYTEYIMWNEAQTGIKIARKNINNLIQANNTTLMAEMEKAMATHSSTLAWKTPWTEEPGGLQSMGSQRIGHDWETSLSLFTFMQWRRKWHPTPVFLPGESQGQRSLVGCCLRGRTELDTTEVT